MVETEALLMHTDMAFFTYQSANFFWKTLHLPSVADVKKQPLESLERILGMLLFSLG